MSKLPTPYLDDIQTSIDLIEKYIGNTDIEHFLNNQLLQDSIIRRLEIIGEATKKLEEEFKQMFPNIPWKKMAGMRDVLIHDYDEVDPDLIWQVAKEDLPELKVSLEKISQTDL